MQTLTTSASYALSVLGFAAVLAWAATDALIWGWAAGALIVANLALLAWLFTQPLPREVRGVRADPLRPERH